MSVLLAAIVAAGAGAFAFLKIRQLRLYKRLRSMITTQVLPDEGFSMFLAERPKPRFDRLYASVQNILPAAMLQALIAEANALSSTERSFVPSHKKGGTIAYQTLIAHAPAVVALYHSAEFQRFLSDVIGSDVAPTPMHDQSSCSLLVYEKPRDHIGWHYDHNFYRGRHFTVLLSLVNEDLQKGGLSSAQLYIKQGEDKELIATPANSLVVFEGAKILHKVSKLDAGQRRVILSMTYCTDPKNSLLQGFMRRSKDVAFFGPRALWT